ncbi:hypothetical protein [Archangium sp.]|uniref:hypothetical protein n=1 Tax=Archangium sp. TaxID=1872627 RepID=UPI00389AE346
MSTPSIHSRPVGTRRCSRVGALALAALMLFTSCARDLPPARAGESHRTWAPEPEDDDEDTGEGEAVLSNLPTDFRPIQVSDTQLTSALTTFWLNVPLRVSTPTPSLYTGRRLALADTPLSGGAWQSELAQAYGRFCQRGGTPGDCLTLFDDGPYLQADDKRSLAVALAVGRRRTCTRTSVHSIPRRTSTSPDQAA